MRFLFCLTFLSLVACTLACNGDFRERAKGDTREFFIVMDSADWDSETSNALRETFGKYVFTLPNPEPYYDLTFMQIRSRSQLERIMGYKNIIFAAPIDDSTTVAAQVRAFLDESTEQRVRNGESFAFPLLDQWYKDQYSLILSSNSDSALAYKIRNTETALLTNALDKELLRWNWFVYEKKEQTQYSDSLWNDHGFMVRIQHDYIKRIDTTNFISYRRFLPDNDRWMWVWWQDDINDISFLDDDWINRTRDSLNQQFIKGRTDSMFITTEYRRPVESNSFQKARYLGYETLGTWQMINGAMGGPFVNFTYYDESTSRLFMVEYSQFAPSVRKKLRFVRQFRAMGRTFKADSLYLTRL
ncbi:MAG: DUF4837 domain-containing protein [Balneola sp.]|nr:DUF4837 domain-containing protein [Balneola sp.]|tara:strand:- start:1056 stop:2129 length:1074 start_codon:yes stop_codon:yes gene_type:complete